METNACAVYLFIVFFSGVLNLFTLWQIVSKRRWVPESAVCLHVFALFSRPAPVFERQGRRRIEPVSHFCMLLGGDFSAARTQYRLQQKPQVGKPSELSSHCLNATTEVGI